MKLRKNINRIALLTSLLMINTNAKGFYQCVPKADWFKNQYDILMLEDKFKVAKTQVDNEHAWELVAENKTNGSLDVGIYRVVLAGGQGGNGYGIDDNTKCEDYNSSVYLGGKGGKGEIKKKVIILKRKTLFTSTIGNKGMDVTCENCNGGAGKSSSFIFNEKKIEANYGEGGHYNNGKYCYNSYIASCCLYQDCSKLSNKHLFCYSATGKDYNPGNSGDGYVKIYKYIG